MGSDEGCDTEAIVVHGSSSVWLPVTFSEQSEEHPDRSWVPTEKDSVWLKQRPASALKSIFITNL